MACWKPCTPPSPQAGLADFLNDLLRRHSLHDLAQSGIPTEGNIVLYVCGIDVTVQIQYESPLLLIEGHVMFIDDSLPRARIFIQQSINHRPPKHGL